MRCFLLLLIFFGSVFTAPQSYEYKHLTPVFENNNFQTVEAPNFLPCTHTKIFNGELLNSQSEARIVNHKSNYNSNQNLVTSASGYNLQSYHSSASNDGNVLTQSIPPPIKVHVPNFELSDTGKKIQPSVKDQGYIYNQATSNTASSLSGQHNLLSSHFVSSEQNIQNLTLPAYSTTSINSPEVLRIVLPNPKPGQSFNGEVTKDHYNAGYVDFTNTVNSASINKNIEHTSNVLLTGGDGVFGSSFGDTALNQDAVGNKNIQHVPIVGEKLNLNTLNGQLGNIIQETFAKAPLDPTIEKHIYVHVPPEDYEYEHQQKPAIRNQFKMAPRKHYKIIFIKAPSYPTPNYNQLAEAVVPQVEEKTLVYVLVKKPEVPTPEQIQQLHQSSFKSSKPEVYFIKYKTRNDGEKNQYTTNLQNGVYTASNIQTHESTGDIIDIRSGGEGISVQSKFPSSSTSYSSPPSEAIVNNDHKHELYGVPLQ